MSYSRFICLLALPALLVMPFSVSAQQYAQESAQQNVQEETKALAEQPLADQAENAVTDIKQQMTETSDQIAPATLTEDLKKARDIIMKNAGDNSFARGLIIALLQPIFLASMFSLGLLAGQMSERFKHVWVLPVLLFAATMVGAFITTYHAEWKPQFEGEQLKFLQSTDMVCVVIGVLVGVTVGFSLGLPVIFALLGAVGVGLILGFSQSAEVDENHLLRFWAGFGLTGLLVNIFGVGFETFFQSINLRMVTRIIGIATAALALFLGAKLF